VVTTPSQCQVYSERSWTVPATVDLKAPAVLVVQAPKHFAVIDQQTVIHIYSYEGRSVSQVKLASCHAELFSSLTVALSDDSLAVRDHRDDKIIHIVDVQSGKELGKPLQHTIGVAQLALEQGAAAALSRHLAFVDKNRLVWA
jgi:intraflagellar transport protein 80